MGTYLRFRQPDLKKLAATNKLLHSVKDAKGNLLVGCWDEEDQRIERSKGERGQPDFFPLGAGTVKLSGCDDDKEADMSRVIETLAEGVDKFGLEVELPTNADDHMSREQIERFTTWRSFRARQTAERREYERWEKARRKAAGESARTGHGVYLVETWGIDKAWLTFGSVTEPRWTLVEYDCKGNWEKVHRPADPRQLFHRTFVWRDEKGRGELMVPQMRLGPGGWEEVRDFLTRAFQIGLRTHPELIGIGLFHITPDTPLKFEEHPHRLEVKDAPGGGYDLKGHYSPRRPDVAAGPHHQWLDWNMTEERFELGLVSGPAVKLRRDMRRKQVGDVLPLLSFRALARLYEITTLHAET